MKPLGVTILVLGCIVAAMGLFCAISLMAEPTGFSAGLLGFLVIFLPGVLLIAVGALVARAGRHG